MELDFKTFSTYIQGYYPMTRIVLLVKHWQNGKRCLMGVVLDSDVFDVSQPDRRRSTGRHCSNWRNFHIITV
jgi:hypothetical protein